MLTYDPLTGEIRWRVDRGGCKGAKAGDLAGTWRKDGYLIISIDSSPCLGQRIAWAIMTGVWPDRIVDHEDTDPSNNEWTNLRLATGEESAANKNKPSHNTSGMKGVRERNGRHLAQITLKGRSKYLGSFATEGEAKAAYDQASIEAWGEFARP
ncbi:HNH endonuclease [Mesorhizobium sp. M0955]|uniref:HNH endonuclease n=1 Tax=Mesorhizobium sp. M0955 TaxID=2957033 RepID=UPI00333C430F